MPTMSNFTSSVLAIIAIVVLIGFLLYGVRRPSAFFLLALLIIFGLFAAGCTVTPPVRPMMPWPAAKPQPGSHTPQLMDEQCKRVVWDGRRYLCTVPEPHFILYA